MILLDCNALCYQAHFTMRTLATSSGIPSGIAYGFWAQVKTIVEQNNDAHLVFCWDSNESHRMALCGTYKADRDKKRAEDPTIFEAFRQFEELHEIIIPRLGFQNNFRVAGFEADDIIASVCKTNKNELITIASNDQDLYQLLTHNVRMYQPVKGRIYTVSMFKEEFGITPEQWVYVKAIAGCPGDNVIGLHGVGVKTVCKYLNDNSGKAYPKIDNKEAKKVISRNWPLVCLPFDGTPKFQLAWPELDFQRWKEFCAEFEFHSFLKGSFWRNLFSYQPPMEFTAPPSKKSRTRRGHSAPKIKNPT